MNPIRPLALAAAALAAGCLFETRVASTEILDPPGKAAVTGILRDAEGRPSAGIWVRAFPVDYNPVLDPRRDSLALLQDTTDGQGAFAIAGLDSGRYNLFAVSASDGSRLLIRDVRLGKDTARIPDSLRLQAPGAIAVNVHDTLEHAGAYVFLQGTPLFSRVEEGVGESRLVIIDSVPAGVSPDIVYAAPEPEGPPVLLAAGVEVVPGDTIPADVYPGWKHSRRILINTSGTAGAPLVGGTVTGFPLLVRLEAGDFDFSAARADGRDVRFAKADGTPLPFEIESWDAAGGNAAVWVRMDTVRGNDASQFLRMYWGNASENLEGQSHGPGVFRIGDGYRGVWHLAEAPGGADSNYRDATAQENHGTGTGFDERSRVETPAGRGHRFRGRETQVRVAPDSSLHSDTALTLEAWVNVDVYQEYGNFVSRAYTEDRRPTYAYGLSLGNEKNNFRFALSNRDSAYQDLFSTQSVVPGRWYHVAATYDGAMMRLFVDGAPADSLPFQGRIADYGMPLLIGMYQNRSVYSLLGVLDEVRVSHVARPAAYMRLAYEAQRAGGRLLRFE